MTEIWTRWEPIGNLERKYNIDAIIDDNTGFTVILSSLEPEHRKVKIYFEDWVESYRSADETLRCSVPYELHKKYGKEFYGNWTFFTVTNSSYIQWLSEQSCTISNGMQLVHFSILAANTVLDLAAISEPKVEHIHE